jgi:hypothetical protein
VVHAITIQQFVDVAHVPCISQDDVPPFPDTKAFAIMEEQLGRPLEQIFSSISERPVAAASLGQVRTRKPVD